MILILAATADPTARRVSRWLRRRGADALQIDCDDPIVDVEIALEEELEEATLQTESGRLFRLSEVRALWYRRGELRLSPAMLGAPPLSRARHQEWSALHEWLMSRLASRPSLGSWEREVRCTKLEQLSAARTLGLAIPATRIGSDPRRLRRAIERWPAAVSKGLQAGLPTPGGTTTTAIQGDVFDPDGPRQIFPKLLQERLTKAIELRIFALGDRTWTLAMVPRRGAEAPLDVRTADLDRTFHLLPYALPATVEAKLLRLMRRLDLDTGSIDMIVDAEGRHVFLEVNPSGQLDWLARALNAPIERHIAEHLEDLARSGPRSRLPLGARRERAVRSRAAIVGSAGPGETPLYRAVPQVSTGPAEATRASESARHLCHGLLDPGPSLIEPRHRARSSAAPVTTEAGRGDPKRSHTPAATAHAPDAAERPDACADAEAQTWIEAPQRFTRACGQRVRVRPPLRPILRRITVPPQPPKATPAGSLAGDAKRARRSVDPGPTSAPKDAHASLDRRLPASLELVEGSRGALLCDLQRGKAFAVPRRLAPRLRAGRWPQAKGPSESRWLRAAEAELGLGLPAQLAAPLPRRSLAWEHPAALIDAVIDVDRGSEHDFSAIFAALAEVGCEHALLRVQRPDALSLIDRILPLLDDAPPLFLEVWLSAEAARVEELIARARRWSRITSFVLFGQPEARERLRPRSGIGTVLTQTEPLDLKTPAAPTPGSMLLRDALFRLSRDHHPAFYGKLAIGADGHVRNAPGLEQSFGPLGARPLRELIATPEFRQLGMISRDRIAGCSECEYRRACTDPREPHLGPDGLYHHRTPCRLDPRRRGRAASGAEPGPPTGAPPRS